MKKLVFIIIASVIAGKIFATAVVRFANESKFTSKALTHKLFLDEPDTANVSDIPTNLKIAKPSRPHVWNHQTFPFVIKSAPVVVAKTGRSEEKVIEDRAKTEKQKEEDERRKKRRKAVEEKTNAIADSHQNTPPAYVPPALAAPINPYPTDIAFAVPTAQPQQQVPPTNVLAANPVTATVASPAGVGALSVSNLSSWVSTLTKNPTASEMTAFEKLYTSNQITQTQFYQVLGDMKASSNEESRNYSVQAANLYKNIYSFQILADESQTESNPTLKSQATTDVNAYAAPADASILQQAQTSSDPNEVAVANRLLGTGTPPTVAVVN